MKNVLALILVAATLVGAEYDLQDIEPFVQAKGEAVKGSVIVKIPKDVFEKVNLGRDLASRAKVDYETAHKEPYYNREYVMDWVLLTKNELVNTLKKEPTREQVFIGWVIGLKKFGKLGYEVEKVTDKDTLLLLKVFQAHELTKKEQNHRVEPPPPLPSDGRAQVPRRYTADWPKNDEVRARFK